MPASTTKRSPGQDPITEPEANDPVLAALRQVEARYQEIYRSFERRNAEAERELVEARKANETLTERLAERDGELQQVRRRVQHQRETSDILATALRDIHRALVSGNVFELILKACLTLTGATRGLYITTDDADKPLRIRAAVDMGDGPSAAPSDFVSALCRAVVENDQVTSCDQLDSSVERDPRESFRNCIAAPVVLRGKPGGIVLVADKISGDFDQDDADALLSVGGHASVAIENARLQQELHDAYLSIVSVLAHTMATRTQQDGRLEETVCRLAGLVAERLGLSEYERSVVYYAALFHDIGNVGVSEGVLNKPGPLLDAERELIRTHTQIGHDLVGEVPLLEPVADIVRHHHERYDGQGYPDGLAGDAIPIAARIVAVADAYGAMLAPRSYRPALSQQEACDEVRRGAGSQFDPEVANAFLAALDATGVQVPSQIPATTLLVAAASGPTRAPGDA